MNSKNNEKYFSDVVDLSVPIEVIKESMKEFKVEVPKPIE
jgi:hypothetical protein